MKYELGGQGVAKWKLRYFPKILNINGQDCGFQSNFCGLFCFVYKLTVQAFSAVANRFVVECQLKAATALEHYLSPFDQYESGVFISFEKLAMRTVMMVHPTDFKKF